VNSDDATAAVIDALDALRIPYMMVGSFSSNFYGIPRATYDVDFVVELEGAAISALARHLRPQFQLDPQMTFETVAATRRYVLQLADSPFSAELFLLSDDAHDQERFARRVRVQAGARDVFVPTVEDVVVTKLRWSHSGRRTKDIDDVRNVIAIQGERIDWAYVNSWCDRHGTRELLEGVRHDLGV
jgi:hypothetical protein